MDGEKTLEEYFEFLVKIKNNERKIQEQKNRIKKLEEKIREESKKNNQKTEKKNIKNNKKNDGLIGFCPAHDKKIKEINSDFFASIIKKQRANAIVLTGKTKTSKMFLQT